MAAAASSPRLVGLVAPREAWGMRCTTDTAGNGSETVVDPTAVWPFAGLQKVWQRRRLRPESLSQKLGFGIWGGMRDGGGGLVVV